MAQEMDVTAKFRADITDMSAKMKSLDSQLKGIETQADKTSKTMSEKFKSAGEGMSKAGKKMTLGITLPLVGIGIAAGKSAMDFEASMSKIVGLVGLSTDEVDGMKDAVLELSGTTAKAPAELADALFVVTSAGLKGQAAIDALTVSAKASTAGLGETADIARAVAGSVNAYGSANLSAAKATDVIVATARAGNFETSQFAGAIGRVLPMAKQAGASLEDMGGAVALLTRTNGDAAQSVTQVQALFKAFVVPTTEAKNVLADLGMTAGDMRDKISKDGLVSAMRELDGALGGNREVLGKLVGSSEAASAAFQILDADADSIAGTFGVTADSVGMTGEAFENATETSAFKFQQALTELKVSLIEVGNTLLPVFNQMVGFISNLTNSFMALSPETKKMAVVAGGLAAAAGPLLLIMGKIATIIGALKPLFMAITLAGSVLAIKIIVVVAAVAALVAIFKWAYDNSESLRTAVSGLMAVFKDIWTLLKDSVLGVFESLTGSTSEVDDKFRDFGGRVKDTTSVLQKIGDFIKKALTVYVQTLTKYIKFLAAAFQVLVKYVQVFITIAKMVGNVIKGVLILYIDILMNKLGPFSTALRAVASGVGNAFVSIANFVKSAFSKVGSFVETFINTGIDAVNALIKAYNMLAGILPGMSKVTEITAFKFKSLGSNAEQAAKGSHHLSESLVRGADLAAGARDSFSQTAKVVKDLATEGDAGTVIIDELGDGVAGAGNAAKTAAEKLAEAKEKFKESFKQIRGTIVAEVDNIKAKMEEMKVSVSDSLMQGFSFDRISKPQLDAQGEEIGLSITQRITEQAEQIIGFSQRINELMRLGLSMDDPLMQMVLAEGATSGLGIADELIAAGAEGIAANSKMLESAQEAANGIGVHAADAFYKAGLDSAEATVKAFDDNFSAGGKGYKRLNNQMTRLARSLDRKSTITVTTINRVINQRVDGARAAGGPVSAAKTYLVGEKGPELFIPNVGGNILPNNELPMPSPPSFGASGGGRMGGGGGNTNNVNSYAITVNTGVGDPRRIGEEIINNLTKFEQANGAVFVRT